MSVLAHITPYELRMRLEEVPVDVPLGPSWVEPHAWRLPCRARILAALKANRDDNAEEHEGAGL